MLFLYSWNSFIFVGLGITHPCTCHIHIVLQDFFSHSLGNNLSGLSFIKIVEKKFCKRTNTLLLIYFLIGLNPEGYVLHGLCVQCLSKKVASECCRSHHYSHELRSPFSPQMTGFVPFATRGHCVVLRFVHRSTSLT